MSFPSGARVGPYEIVSLLGSGGMGEVYRAKDVRIGREVAIKVIAPRFASDPDRLARFEQEIRASGALNHPNIVMIHDVGTHEAAPYFVSELLEGETLRDRLQPPPISIKKTVEYGIAIARGLAAAHDKGIVHRDLKPENLFVTKDDRVKILDFGLAKLTYSEAGSGEQSNLETTPATKSGVVMGTVGYMSPEQVSGRKADLRSDIFSFGAILYEMLSGRRAFEGATAVEKMNAILKEEPPSLSQISPSISPTLERIVNRCLEKDPDKRFRSAHDLAFALATVFDVPSNVNLAPVSSGANRKRLLPVVVAVFIVGTAALAFLAGRNAGFVSQDRLSFEPVTFRRGTILSARFAPDGHTILYTAAWEGHPPEVFSGLPGSPEARSLGFSDSRILSVSSTGEMALLLHFRSEGLGFGTLAVASLSGGAPREVLEDVRDADWSPEGKLAVVRWISGQNQKNAQPISRIEFPIGKVLYQSPRSILHLRVSPDGKRIVFDDFGSIVVMDLLGNTKVLASGAGAVWSPDGKEVWLMDAATDKESGFDLVAVSLSGKRRLLYRSATKSWITDISKSGQVLMLSETDRLAINILAPGDAKEHDFSWFNWSTCKWLSPDGRMLLFYEGGGGTGHAATYVRKTDGSPAVPLGNVDGFSVSRDGAWVIASTDEQDTKLQIMPTGPGESKSIMPVPMMVYHWAGWLPDEKRIAFMGSESNGNNRLWIQEIAGGKPRAISPSLPVHSGSISPDGTLVAVIASDQKVWLYPLDSGEPRSTPIVTNSWDRLVGWAEDGRSIYLYRWGEVPDRVYRVDIATGSKELWKELMPSDPAGVNLVSNVLITPDAKSYVYAYRRTLSELYVVDGFE